MCSVIIPGWPVRSTKVAETAEEEASWAELYDLTHYIPHAAPDYQNAPFRHRALTPDLYSSYPSSPSRRLLVLLGTTPRFYDNLSTALDACRSTSWPVVPVQGSNRPQAPKHVLSRPLGSQ